MKNCDNIQELSDFLMKHNIKPSFQRIFSKKTQFIDGNEGTIKQLLRKAPMIESDTQSVEFYFSGIPATTKELNEIKTYLSRLEEVYYL